ncbi:MAG: membrane integrity-associated transporter subunit PqiC [Pseudomonadota bacterium]|nr:membrane integrity-associated transporter subunit PqiC [Pseudomonadota bacterium]
MSLLPRPPVTARLSCLLALCLLMLAACSLQPVRPAATAQFDLGAAVPRADGAGPAVQLVDCAAPPWLADTSMRYRLGWLEPLQLQAYRDSRWLAPPCALLGQRVRAQQPVAAGPGVRQLRIELDAFEQEFSAPQTSDAVVRLRASLALPEAGGSLRSRSFSMRRPAGGDARSGALALAQATDALLAELGAWVREP